MFVRQHCHVFSRKAKCMCAFSITIVAGWIIMLRLGVAYFDLDAVVDQGNFHLDWVVVDGIFGMLGSLFVNYPIMYLLK